LGIPLQALHWGLQKRLVPSIVRRSVAAAASLSFEQLPQVVYDKYDPHYRWRRKLAGSPVQSLGLGLGAGCAASVGLFQCHENAAAPAPQSLCVLLPGIPCLRPSTESNGSRGARK
jgi:hypothetical protein